MRSETIATLVAFVVIALIITGAVYAKTGNGWWTAGVAIVGSGIATGVLRFLFGKARELLGQ